MLTPMKQLPTPARLVFDTLELGCPKCRALPNEPCINLTNGHDITKPHKERSAYSTELTERTTGNTQNARWWRWRMKNHGPPAPRGPEHGTIAAYVREKRRDETPCEECTIAAREFWKTQKRAQTKAKYQFEPLVTDS